MESNPWVRRGSSVQGIARSRLDVAVHGHDPCGGWLVACQPRWSLSFGARCESTAGHLASASAPDAEEAEMVMPVPNHSRGGSGTRGGADREPLSWTGSSIEGTGQRTSPGGDVLAERSARRGAEVPILNLPFVRCSISGSPDRRGRLVHRCLSRLEPWSVVRRLDPHILIVAGSFVVVSIPAATAVRQEHDTDQRAHRYDEHRFHGITSFPERASKLALGSPTWKSTYYPGAEPRHV